MSRALSPSLPGSGFSRWQSARDAAGRAAVMGQQSSRVGERGSRANVQESVEHSMREVGSVETGIVEIPAGVAEWFSDGEGTTVVLLPGGGLTVEYLQDLAERLAAAGMRAVRVNRRGIGQSTGALDGITYHDYAADTASLIEALDLAPAFVLGHAFGNRIARTLAADRSDLLRGVILVSAGGRVPPEPGAGSALRAESKAFGLQIGRDFAPHVSESERAASQATPLDEWWAPPGTTPYLVIQGLADRAAPPENGRLLKAELGERATLVELPGVGHLQPIQAPGAVAYAVIPFVQRLAPNWA